MTFDLLSFLLGVAVAALILFGYPPHPPASLA